MLVTAPPHRTAAPINGDTRRCFLSHSSVPAGVYSVLELTFATKARFVNSVSLNNYQYQRNRLRTIALVRLDVVVEGNVLGVHEVEVPLAAHRAHHHAPPREVVLGVSEQRAARPHRHRAQRVGVGQVPELPPHQPGQGTDAGG